MYMYSGSTPCWRFPVTCTSTPLALLWASMHPTHVCEPITCPLLVHHCLAIHFQDPSITFADEVWFCLWNSSTFSLSCWALFGIRGRWLQEIRDFQNQATPWGRLHSSTFTVVNCVKESSNNACCMSAAISLCFCLNSWPAADSELWVQHDSF